MPLEVRALHLLPVAAGRQMRLVEHQLGESARRAGGDAGRLQRLHRLVRRALPRSRPRSPPPASSSRGAPAVGRGQRGIGAPRSVRPITPQSARQAASSVTAITTQASSPSQGKQPCGDEDRVPVAGRGRDLAGHRLLDQPGRDQREQALDLAEIDELTLAGALAVQQRRQQRRAGRQPADRIAIGDVVHGRRIVGPACHARQARTPAPASSRRPAPRPRASLAPNAGIDIITMSGRSARKAGVVEPEAWPARPGRSSPPPRRPCAPGRSSSSTPSGWVRSSVMPILLRFTQLKVERLLVAERGDRLVAVVGAAPPVRIAAALDLDHLGAEVGELARAHRPGPAHGEVDDAQARPAAAPPCAGRPRWRGPAMAARLCVCCAGQRGDRPADRRRRRQLLRQHRRLERGLADPHLAERAVVAVHAAWPAASPCPASPPAARGGAIASSAHSRAVRAGRAAPRSIASSSSPTSRRSGAVAKPGRFTSSGTPSMSQKPRHWSAEKAVTPSQPCLVG